MVGTDSTVVARRDISNGFELATELRHLVDSTPFHCKVSFFSDRRVGLLCVEYHGHNEREVIDCDLKLTAGIICFLESSRKGDVQLLPLELI